MQVVVDAIANPVCSSTLPHTRQTPTLPLPLLQVAVDAIAYPLCSSGTTQCCNQGTSRVDLLASE